LSWHDQIAEGFPHRHDQEPGQLRSDIVDELADHLSCAMDRELRRTDDEATARRAVLARFGNPMQIARKLWFDAMKETVMKDRVMMITAALMAAACIGLALMVMSALQQNRQVNEAILANLNAPRPVETPATNLEWASATLQLVNAPGRIGPLSGIKVELDGNAINPSKNIVLTELTDSQGVATFAPIRPGQFLLRVRGEAGLFHERWIAAMPGGEQDEQLVWPGSLPTVNVSFEIAWPEDLRDKDILLHCNLLPKIETRQLQGAEWKGPSQIRLMLNGSGEVLHQAVASVGDEYNWPWHPGGWASAPSGTPRPGVATLIPGYYEIRFCAVYGPRYDPMIQAPHDYVMAGSTQWEGGSAPGYEASRDGSGNRWLITMPDSTLDSVRMHPTLAQAFLNDQLAAAGYGAVLRTLPITKTGAVEPLPNGRWKRTETGEYFVVFSGSNSAGFLCQWPTIPPDEGESPERRFVLALHANKATGSTANHLQLHEVLEDWDGAEAEDLQISAEPVGTYDFKPGSGWKLFDVTNVVQARIERGDDDFGVTLRLADSSLIPKGADRTHGRYYFSTQLAQRARAPFRPVLLVVEADDVTD